MCRWEYGRVVHVLCHSQELLAERERCLQLGTREIITPQTMQYREKLVGICEVFTELPSVEVGLSNFGSCMPLRGNQRCAEGNMDRHFLLGTLTRLRQRLEHRQPLTEM